MLPEPPHLNRVTRGRRPCKAGSPVPPASISGAVLTLKSMDVSDPTKARVTFALNAVSEDTTERWLADLPVDETTGIGQAPNANLIINEAKIALAIRLRGAL